MPLLFQAGRAQAQHVDRHAGICARVRRGQLYVGEITAREAAQTAEQATQVDLQNKAKQLEADVREYEMKLQRFQGELGQYERAVETTFRKIEASIGRRKESLRMLTFDRNRLQERADRARRALLHGTKATPSINPLSGY